MGCTNVQATTSKFAQILNTGWVTQEPYSGRLSDVNPYKCGVKSIADRTPLLIYVEAGSPKPYDRGRPFRGSR
jgi:hypothetical protein